MASKTTTTTTITPTIATPTKPRAPRKLRTLRISNSTTEIRLEFRDKVTVILDETGTEKSLLIHLLSSYTANASSTSTAPQAPHPHPDLLCNTDWLILRASDWNNQIHSINGGIIFVDADEPYVDTPEFKQALQFTNNYLVIFTTHLLQTFPDNLHSMYRIHTSGKTHKMKPLYRIYYGYLFVDNKPRKEIYDLYTHSRAALLANHLINEPITKHYGASTDSLISWIQEHMDHEKIWVIIREDTNGVVANNIIALHEKVLQKLLVSKMSHLMFELYGDGYMAQPYVNGIDLGGTEWETWFQERINDRYRNLPEEERDVFYTMESAEKDNERIAFVFIF